MELIKKFTYEDYLKYTKENKQYLTLNEESEEYKLENIHQYRDKGYKLVLEDKEEAVQFINKTLKLENTPDKIKREEIEQYNSSFITSDFKSKELDIVYKKKDKDIFFLIEHQSKVDYSMAYRMLNYCIEIIRSAVNPNKLRNKKYKIPVVYPIVLYTGKSTWNAKKYFEECQERLKWIEGRNFASYNLVDINNYTEEELWKEKNFLSKMLLLEKAKTNNKVQEYIKEIEKENFSNKEINILVQMIYHLVDREIGEKEIKEFIERMKNRKGDENMSALEEYLDSLINKKIEKGIEKGKIETKEAIVIKMLKNKMDEETIKLMTEITQEELEKIKEKI